MPSDPLFIVGTERSGSNLLRLILDSHSSIVIPHPPHVVRYFAPLVSRYGNLAETPRFRALVDDVLQLVHAHIHPWPWVPGADEVIERCASRDLLTIYAALHDAVKERSGKNRWGCKSTFMIHVAEEVLRRWPNGRLLWLYRDPRDVAASSRDSVFSTFHPIHTARLWTEQQDLGLQIEAKQPGNVLRVRYESLVADPEAEVTRICTFLGEKFQPGMLQWFAGAEAKRSAALAESWSNTAAPMREDRRERWRRDLTPMDARSVEVIAGATMAALGYARADETSEGVAAARNAGCSIWLADRWMRARVELRSIRRDKNAWKRWRRGAVMARIRWRLRLRGR